MSNNIEQLVTNREIEEELKIVDYVAGRMPLEQRRQFEEQIVADPALAASVAHERSLRNDLSDSGGAGVPPASAFDKVRDQLAPPTKQPSQFRMAASVAAVLGLAVSLVLVMEREPAPTYEGLSSESVSLSDRSTDIRLMFAPAADDALRQRVSERLGFDIVSGPGPGGSYVVRPRSGAAVGDLDQWVSDPDVRFAERIVYQP